jgi:predicted cupin superfamily sugar epimerase
VRTADDVIRVLALAPHPEGGFFRETWRHDAGPGERGAGTAIYFLLRAGDRSHWHRVDADEVWHFHAGAPLTLWRTADADTPPDTAVLGIDLHAGQEPQLRVPAGWWQSAASTGDWTLVSCTVAPAFEFAGFELAPPDFEPGRR